MAKTNISMPDALLEEVDSMAKASNTTRSGFVQEAAAHYIATLKAEKAADERSRRIQKAMDEMKALSKEIPPGPEGRVLIRQMRDAQPDWLTGSDVPESGACD